MKFDMGNATLSTLTKNTDNAGGDLGTLVKQLVQAAEPLEGKFNGAGRQAFDQFKANVDEVSNDLTVSLGAILTGQSGMDEAFQTGDQQASDNATSAQGSANFDGARFAGNR